MSLILPFVCLCSMVLSKHIVEAQDIYSSSYSTYGEQINGKLVRLDSLPHKSFTHFMVKKDGEPASYTFTVETSKNSDGMFVNFVEFGERKAGQIFKTTRSICNEYNMQFNYSSGEVERMCYNNKDDLQSMIYGGVGSAQVTITSKTTNSHSDSSSKSMVGPNGREIPLDSIGFITFTLYSDCTAGRPGLRSCSDQNKNRCIAAELFCDGEDQCVEQIKTNPWGFRFSFLVNYDGFDESSARCTNDRSWKQTSSVWKTIMFIVVGVIILLCSICGRALRGKTRASGHNEESGVPQQIDYTQAEMARDGVYYSDDVRNPMPPVSANGQKF